MANPQNLIPGQHPLTVEEASKGGKASGRSRLRKKHGKELLRALLEMPETDPRILEEMRALGIVDKDATNEVVLHARQLSKAKRKADTLAYKAILQAAGFTRDEDHGNGTTVNVIVASKDEADKIASIGNIG